MSRRSTVVGFAAIVVLMSAAAAQGLSGSNTVFSDDIVDGQIRHIDIRENTIGSSRMLDNSVHGVKVADQTLVAGQDFGTRAVSISLNFPSISAGGCERLTAIAGGFGTLTRDATALTAPSSFPDDLSVHAENGTTMSGEVIRVVACNPSGGAIDPGAGTFKLVTFRVP